MPFMHISEAHEGSRVRLDDGFTCHRAGIVYLKKDKRGNLYFRCRSGSHNIDGQLDDDNRLIGMILENR